MTKDEIIRMAREAGSREVMYVTKDTGGTEVLEFTHEQLERFAALVAAHKREACAKVCDEVDQRDDIHPDHVAIECAAAIRARGGND